mgnify:CR=1 FL=1
MHHLRYCLTLGLISLCLALIAQPTLQTQAGYSYLRHGQLSGVHFDNTATFGQGAHRWTLGLGLNHAEGNRNFDPDRPGVYTIQFGDYIPPYQFFLVRTFNYDHPVELPPLTTQIFQLTGRVGYSYQFPNLPLSAGGGIYLSYVNKTYIADLLYDTDIYWRLVNLDIVYDLAIPFYLRYLAVGPYLHADYTFWQGEAVSWGLGTSYHFSRNRHGWLDVGVVVTFGS